MPDDNNTFNRDDDNDLLEAISRYDRYLNFDSDDSTTEKDALSTLQKVASSDAANGLTSIQGERAGSALEKNPFKRFYNNKWLPLSKGKKTASIIISVVLVLAIIVFGIANSYLNLIDWKAKGDPLGISDDENDINAAAMRSISDANGLRDYLKKWYTNGGELMSSSHVMNVLLLGLDDGSAHSDAIIIASLNKRTDEIILTSVYRDSYTYSNSKYLIDTAPEYMKLTEVYTYGGAEAVSEAIENNFKIKLDGYVSIDFESFPKAIDALGGVRVPITPAESAYMANPWNTYVDSGDSVLLTGEQALVYSRIRYLDGDIERARRQRAVISSLIDASKTASVSQIDMVLNEVLPSVTTSFSKLNFVNYGTQAITQKWMSYPMKQIGMPTEKNGGTAYIGDKWYWIADYPGCAYELQMLIYGQSNITLADDRQTVFDFLSHSNDTPSGGYTKPLETESDNGALQPPASPNDNDDAGIEATSTTARETTTKKTSDETTTSTSTTTTPETTTTPAQLP